MAARFNKVWKAFCESRGITDQEWTIAYLGGRVTGRVNLPHVVIAAAFELSTDHVKDILNQVNYKLQDIYPHNVARYLHLKQQEETLLKAAAMKKGEEQHVD